MLRHLDLFSGIGGFALGLERTGGFKTVAFCEIEPYCRKVLKKHWPVVPIEEDVRHIDAEQYRPDIITGGFPCQDVSIAGTKEGLGEATRSGLWSECLRAICSARPRYAIMENVSNLLSGPSEQRGGWFSRILRDLASIGYDAEWHIIPATFVGSPQERERVWIIAYPSDTGLQRPVLDRKSLQGCDKKKSTEFGNTVVSCGDGWSELRPYLRMGDGVSSRTHPIKALGNAVVPQIPEMIGRAILEAKGEG